MLFRSLNDPMAAERLYLEVRTMNPTSRQDVTASNQLIDLYRATGQRGRLMVELARFSERYKGTRAAREARRLLDELKAETTSSS